MSAMRKIKDFFAHTGETEYREIEEVVEDYDYPAEADDIVPFSRGRGFERAGDTISFTPKRPMPKSEIFGDDSTAFGIGGVNALPQIILASPKTIDEASGVADMLEQGKTVLICLDDISFEDSVRIVDFLSGSVYTSKGAITQTQKRNFLVTPKGVEVTEQHKEQLKSSGILKNAFRR
ncbi:MAG: cell division protein SepF [Defluviitaleaceae bacterium]|nr:cell division protein SepF [Defluviitaleaceae bacterium]